MPRKGENIRKRKDGRWEARYEKCRDQNGRIQYGYLYGRTYEAVKQKKLDILCQNNPRKFCGKRYVFRNLSEEWMLSMRYAVKLSTYACYDLLPAGSPAWSADSYTSEQWSLPGKCCCQADGDCPLCSAPERSKGTFSRCGSANPARVFSLHCRK